MAVFEKQVNVQCGIGSISMLISSHIHNAANCAIAKNSWQSYFKKFEVFFSRKQQGAIRTDWKIYSCIFYHLCIMVMIFQVASSLSIFQQQYPLWRNTENRWKVIIYNHVKSKKIMSPKDDFQTIFDFTLPFFKALSQDGWIINLNNIRVIFTLYFL